MPGSMLAKTSRKNYALDYNGGDFVSSHGTEQKQKSSPIPTAREIINASRKPTIQGCRDHQTPLINARGLIQIADSGF